MIARWAWSVIALGLPTAACAMEGSDSKNETVYSVGQEIVGGSASEKGQDATVMLLHLDPAGPRRVGICTAALVAPRLVLTARHCVSTADDQVACAADGTPLVGAKILSNHEPTNLYVFTGSDRPEFIGEMHPTLDTTKWKPAGRGAEIIDDESGTLCSHDLALVLLEQPIANIPLAALRLDGSPSSGDKVLTVGWGVTSGEVEPSKRQQRRGVTVKRVGPSEEFPVLTRSEFLIDESICLGDSGGPVFAEETNAIVGVVSRGGNGLDPNKGGPSSTCQGAVNIATRLSPFKDLVMEGFRRAGAEPKLEQRPEEACSVATPGTGGARGMLLWSSIGIGLMAFTRRRRPQWHEAFPKRRRAPSRSGRSSWSAAA